MIRLCFILLSFTLYLSPFASTEAAPLSAFQAQAIAEKSLSANARGKVIRIEGPRGSATVTPITWKFLFFDPKAEQQGRLVTVSGNVVTELIEGYIEPFNLRLAAYKEEEVIPAPRLKIDSNAALSIVNKTPALHGLKLSTVTFLLSKAKGNVEPTWLLRLFADNKGYEVDIGSARVSAESGKILELKLDTKKLKD